MIMITTVYLYPSRIMLYPIALGVRVVLTIFLFLFFNKQALWNNAMTPGVPNLLNLIACSRRRVVIGLYSTRMF